MMPCRLVSSYRSFGEATSIFRVVPKDYVNKEAECLSEQTVTIFKSTRQNILGHVYIHYLSLLAILLTATSRNYQETISALVLS